MRLDYHPDFDDVSTILQDRASPIWDLDMTPDDNATDLDNDENMTLYVAPTQRMLVRSTTSPINEVVMEIVLDFSMEIDEQSIEEQNSIINMQEFDGLASERFIPYYMHQNYETDWTYINEEENSVGEQEVRQCSVNYFWVLIIFLFSLIFVAVVYTVTHTW